MIKRFILLVVLLAGTALTVIFGEGFNFLNPDPTETMAITNTVESTFPVEATATAIFTETQVPTATSEFTSTPVPTATEENTPTETATPTNTPTATATATPTEDTDLFAIQTGSPVFTTNFAHPEAACNWQGIAGQMLSKTGAPLQNYILKLTGTYNGSPINQIVLSGLVTNEPYGPGSFEFVLGSTPIDSVSMMTIQVFSPTYVEVMGPESVSTYASCSQNLEIINFKQK
jgi:hypothetical protein